jgi:prepilin-type processing-associated H-X9-DG protein
VELLVVIGIIAVLISILLPVLGRVREAATRTKCQAQLRDIGMQIQMYLNEKRLRVPRVNPFPWAPELLGYPAPTLVETLFPYHKGATKVFECPADTIINVAENSSLAGAESYYEACGTSYEYNVFFNAFWSVDEVTGVNKTWTDALADSKNRGVPEDRLMILRDMDPFHSRKRAAPEARNALYADWHVGPFVSARHRPRVTQ